MKCGVLRTVCFAVLFSALLTPSFSQNYYLVVGAFSSDRDDLREFTSVLPGVNNDTSYTITTNNSMLHFYVMKTSDKELAMAKAQNLQEGLQVNESFTRNANPSPLEGNIVRGTIAEPNTTDATASAKGASDITSTAAPALKPKGKFFKFTILSENGSALPGELHHVDLARQRELGSFTTDTYIDVLRPGKSQTMTMVCGVFGYKEIQKEVDFSNPQHTDEVYQDSDGAWVVPYRLERLEKGDVSVMYNVSFYKDAVQMLPPSRKDLDELVSMMKSNPDYVIKVHAHCNGKNSRKMIVMADNSNFFDARESAQVKGSAKELTNLRAEAIKNYLLANGISKDRIKTYGWGGSEMLVDENSTHAKLNDRIEIEILKD
jgi:outer membrane protein OmpA-like peptidoglycan-associated protein